MTANDKNPGCGVDSSNMNARVRLVPLGTAPHCRVAVHVDGRSVGTRLVSDVAGLCDLGWSAPLVRYLQLGEARTIGSPRVKAAVLGLSPVLALGVQVVE